MFALYNNLAPLNLSLCMDCIDFRISESLWAGEDKTALPLYIRVKYPGYVSL